MDCTYMALFQHLYGTQSALQWHLFHTPVVAAATQGAVNPIGSNSRVKCLKDRLDGEGFKPQTIWTLNNLRYVISHWLLVKDAWISSQRPWEVVLIFSRNLLNWESRRLPGSFASCLQLPARRCCQGSEAYEPAPSSIVTSEVRPIPLIFDADSFSTPAAAPEPNILQAWFALSVCWGILSQTLVYNLR